MSAVKQDNHKAMSSFRHWFILWTLHKAFFTSLGFCRKRTTGLHFCINFQDLPFQRTLSHNRADNLCWSVAADKFGIQSLHFLRVRALNLLWVWAEHRARSWPVRAQLVWLLGLCTAFQPLSLSNSMPPLYFYFLSPLLCLSTERNDDLHFLICT